MKKMDMIDCKKALNVAAKKSQKSGYMTDAADAMFRVFVLELLTELINTTKKHNFSKIFARMEKLEGDLDFYIKEYPEQMAKLEHKDK